MVQFLVVFNLPKWASSMSIHMSPMNCPHFNPSLTWVSLLREPLQNGLRFSCWFPFESHKEVQFKAISSLPDCHFCAHLHALSFHLKRAVASSRPRRGRRNPSTGSFSVLKGALLREKPLILEALLVLIDKQIHMSWLTPQDMPETLAGNNCVSGQRE